MCTNTYVACASFSSLLCLGVTNCVLTCVCVLIFPFFRALRATHYTLHNTTHNTILFLYSYSPTGNSFMTGRRPDATKSWNFRDSFREKGVGADWITLPEFFRIQSEPSYTVVGECVCVCVFACRHSAVSAAGVCMPASTVSPNCTQLICVHTDHH